MNAEELYAEATSWILTDWDREMADRYPDNAPRNAVKFGSHAEVKRALADVGSHFYDRQAVRSFNAKTSDAHLAAGRFWIESSKFEDDPRTYRVAWISRTAGSDFLSVERSEHFLSLNIARKARNALADAVRALEGN